MDQDKIQRFLFESHNIRGEIVRLNDSYRTIMEQHNYPQHINKFLGETLLAGVLITNSIKFNGQLTLQFTSDGPIKMLVAKCSSDLKIRGLAQWDNNVDAKSLSQGLKLGQLVVTLESDSSVRPHQSIVALKDEGIAPSLEYYFLQSEQLLTRFLLFAQTTDAFGILLQVLPTKENAAASDKIDYLLQKITQYITDHSIDMLNNEALLQTIFDSEDIRIFEPAAVTFACSCSLARTENAIRTFGLLEIEDILKEKPYVVVNCEFCNKDYSFNKDDIKRIFAVDPRKDAK